MLPQSLIKDSSRGNYRPLDEDEDNRDSTGLRSRANATPLSQTSFLWLYLMLSAFAGFVVAIVMVNIFPGDIVGEKSASYGNSKLDKLLRMPKQRLTFVPVDLFQRRPSKESDAAWEALLGPSIGLISLNNSQSYGLPKGANANNDESGSVYQLSVVHQIQCLYLIRKVYFGANTGIFNTSATPVSALVQHTNHCFDYLLQSIKCSADMSLESKTDDGGNFVGWGTEHGCSKWDSVTSFMKKYKYDEAEKAVDHHHHDDDDDDEEKGH